MRSIIQRGYLKEFVDRGKTKAQKPAIEVGQIAPPIESGERTTKEQVKKENLPIARIIGVISGGPAGGDSIRARKAAIRETSNVADHVAFSEVMTKKHESFESEITFNKQDLERLLPATNDAIVIAATIANFWIKKILIDSGSSRNILFYRVFPQMGIDNARLTPMNTALTNFSGDIVEPLGEIVLPISLGSYPRRTTKFVTFLVVDSPSAYNVIFGRPNLNLFQAVASTYHLKIKFPTHNGIGEEIGDSRQARECYAITLKNPAGAPSLKLENQKRLHKTSDKSQEENPQEEDAGKEPREEK
ncbi:UNVERIFIED_CONTAM: hypothetical protein Sangu_3021700 [Sesamum angustifolium]|uniref:Uncharacterized protein n=1 Tax=Sesamum angustifolium TaxID=2727405 RepID=A0AAW2KM74_9LAMI